MLSLPSPHATLSLVPPSSPSGLFQIDRSGTIPWLRFRDRESYARNKTKEYDALAMRYFSYALYPLVAGYAMYSLIYETHKSWYSWVLNSLTGCVYTFGFIMMCPQLFINYKLKSVAHLPWRQMTYKFLNTIVDDLFAFVIKMPTLHRLSGMFLNTIVDDLFAFVIKMPTPHRLSVFRDGAWKSDGWGFCDVMISSSSPSSISSGSTPSTRRPISRRTKAAYQPMLVCLPVSSSPPPDIIFLIFLYQRWIYPVDKQRVNEYGFGGEPEAAALAGAPAAGGDGAADGAGSGKTDRLTAAEAEVAAAAAAAGAGAAAAAAAAAGGAGAGTAAAAAAVAEGSEGRAGDDEGAGAARGAGAHAVSEEGLVRRGKGKGKGKGKAGKGAGGEGEEGADEDDRVKEK
ncbi:unnamed protein product [Closterium sp. Naga37s-1]|nr:unnamed protein product [Closterium sp. Naga37s-1]